jgi:hypothetical protein
VRADFNMGIVANHPTIEPSDRLTSSAVVLALGLPGGLPVLRLQLVPEIFIGTRYT